MCEMNLLCWGSGLERERSGFVKFIYFIMKNQRDALSISNLFRHSTSTCVRHVLPIIRRYTL
jgi:hypothetical protein